MQLDHINLSAPADLLETLKNFYCTLFDLQQGFRPKFRRNGFWLYAGDKPIIHLTESNDHFRNPQRGYLDHIAFQRDDFSAFVARMQRLKIDYQLASIEEIGMKQIFFSDPSGLGLEVNFLDDSR